MKFEKSVGSTGKRVLVTGGRGFIGRNVVRHLERLGARVIIGTRSLSICDDHSSKLRTVRLHELVTAADCETLLKDVDVVINAVGILRQRGSETYERVHHHGVAALARACVARNLRYVHVSILGIDAPVRSRFTVSKRHGEAAVRRCGGDWYIVRPSLVEGNDGFGARWFRHAAAWPVHVTPANATGGFSPVSADDLGKAIAHIALHLDQPEKVADRVFELGGESTLLVPEYLAILSPTSRRKPVIQIPGFLARLVSHCCDLLHVTPFSFGHYELLQFANVPGNNRLPELLGRKDSTSVLIPVGKEKIN